jgi:hypothetical protein
MPVCGRILHRQLITPPWATMLALAGTAGGGSTTHWQAAPGHEHQQPAGNLAAAAACDSDGA